MEWREQFNLSCENIERESVALDEDIDKFFRTHIESVKDQLPKMLRIFHERMRYLLTPNETKSNLP